MNHSKLFQEIAELQTETDEILSRHKNIMKELRSSHWLNRDYRAETLAERSRRFYWNKKLGTKFDKIQFWFVQPELLKDLGFCVSSLDDARAKFLKPEKNYVPKDRAAPAQSDKQIIPVNKMPRVRIWEGSYKDREGLVTAVRGNEYRVTIMPDQNWKSKVRRWMTKDQFEVLSGTLPRIRRKKTNGSDMG